MANTTWNPSDVSANITLSGSNLVATSTSITQGGARGVAGKKLGKHYVEFTCTTISGTASGVGAVYSGASLATMGTASSAGRGAFVLASGHIWTNGVDTGATLGALANGDVICMALDKDNRQVWFRKGAGNWNGVATNDPTISGTGVYYPSTISQVGSMDAWYIALISNVSGNAVSVNVGDTAFSQTVPSGYTSGWTDTDTSGVQDLGSISKRLISPFNNAKMFSPAAAMKYLSGTVTEAGVGVARTMRAFERISGALISSTTSASDGTFSLPTNGVTGECFVVAFASPDGPPAYNAVIYDGVIPV